jgi:hypothetical protein
MSKLHARLKRLETAAARNRTYLSAWDLLFESVPLPEGFNPERDLDPRHVSLWHSMVTLPRWLEERGYPDHLAALEAGETGPEGLEDSLREQARHDLKHRAWERFITALDAHQLPKEADNRGIIRDGEES